MVTTDSPGHVSTAPDTCQRWPGAPSSPTIGIWPAEAAQLQFYVHGTSGGTVAVHRIQVIHYTSWRSPSLHSDFKSKSFPSKVVHVQIGTNVYTDWCECIHVSQPV